MRARANSSSAVNARYVFTLKTVFVSPYKYHVFSISTIVVRTKHTPTRSPLNRHARVYNDYLILYATPVHAQLLYINREPPARVFRRRVEPKTTLLTAF